jgi:hypothetical protein
MIFNLGARSPAIGTAPLLCRLQANVQTGTGLVHSLQDTSRACDVPSDPGSGRVMSSSPLRAWLELLRPANIATAPADVLAGAAVAGALLPVHPSLVWLVLATMALYAGGIVLNDVFDSRIDALERPERPIPSGRVTLERARQVGLALLVTGVLLAIPAGPLAAALAAAINAAVLAYDAGAKHHPVVGPFVMGTCRGLNLLLGVSIAPGALAAGWPTALLPLIYIAGVTVVSRGEVHGSRRPVVIMGLVMVAGVVGVLLALAAFGEPGAPLPALDRAIVLAVALWLAARVLPPFTAIVGQPAPALIGRAVRTGVLSLVLVETVIAGSYAGIMAIPAVLAAGLIAWMLARLFAVT